MQLEIEDVKQGAYSVLIKTPLREILVPLDAASDRLEEGDIITAKKDGVIETPFGVTHEIKEY